MVLFTKGILGMEVAFIQSPLGSTPASFAGTEFGTIRLIRPGLTVRPMPWSATVAEETRMASPRPSSRSMPLAHYPLMKLEEYRSATEHIIFGVRGSQRLLDRRRPRPSCCLGSRTARCLYSSTS